MVAHNLNPKQLQAVESSPGPLLIIAGAGSGKTKTLTNRLQYLLSNGVEPDRIIAITFTNKAAGEMSARIARDISIFKHLNVVNGQGPFIGTFHSLGARILRKEARNLGRGMNYTIYDSDDSLSAIKRTIKSLNLSKKDALGPSLLRYYISKMKSGLITADDLVDIEKLEVVRAVAEEYEKELARNNAFDFDDLILKPVQLWRENPLILQKYQDKYRYVLVDEFQDVNTAQYEFVRLLAKNHKNINVVGDDAQAIYGFRSANYKHFLNFEHDWPETKVIFLEENYRSTQTILSAANAIIQNNKSQKPKNLWTKKEKGEPIAIHEHEDEVAEAEWIASEIEKQFQTTNNLQPTTNNQEQKTKRTESREIESESVEIVGDKLSVVGKSTAILYRTNAQSRAIEQALIEHNIQYQLFGSIRFYERKEIKDIVACLRYASNPQDAVSLDRMKKSLYAKPFRELMSELPDKAKALQPYELIVYCLNISNYFEYLKKNYPNADERIENLEELMGFSENYPDLNDFLEKVTLLQSTDNENTKTNTAADNVEMFKCLNVEPVRLMTIHIAKGLEFDKVYVVGVNEGLLPHQMSYGTTEEIEEERRLMYVAITRARSELALSFFDLGSRFLYEIPTELIVFKSSDPHGLKDFSDDEERYISFD